MDMMEAVRRRRSIRNYRDTPVTEGQIMVLIDAARLAPSGSNAQNWMFGLITDKEKISALADAAGGQDWIRTAPLVIALCAELRRNFKTMKEGDFGLTVNRLRFGKPFMDHMAAFDDQRAVGKLFENGNMMLAGEHICLAASSMGLGSCWIGYLDVDRAGEILGLPDDHACLFLLPIGHPDEEPKEKERKGFDDVTFRNEWGSGRLP